MLSPTSRWLARSARSTSIGCQRSRPTPTSSGRVVRPSPIQVDINGTSILGSTVLGVQWEFYESQNLVNNVFAGFTLAQRVTIRGVNHINSAGFDWVKSPMAMNVTLGVNPDSNTVLPMTAWTAWTLGNAHIDCSGTIDDRRISSSRNGLSVTGRILPRNVNYLTSNLDGDAMVTWETQNTLPIRASGGARSDRLAYYLDVASPPPPPSGFELMVTTAFVPTACPFVPNRLAANASFDIGLAQLGPRRTASGEIGSSMITGTAKLNTSFTGAGSLMDGSGSTTASGISGFDPISVAAYANLPSDANIPQVYSGNVSSPAASRSPSTSRSSACRRTSRSASRLPAFRDSRCIASRPMSTSSSSTEAWLLI